MENDPRFRIQPTSLVAYMVDRHIAGIFTCRAFNKAGHDIKRALLSILPSKNKILFAQVKYFIDLSCFAAPPRSLAESILSYYFQSLKSALTSVYRPRPSTSSATFPFTAAHRMDIFKAPFSADVMRSALNGEAYGEAVRLLSLTVQKMYGSSLNSNSYSVDNRPPPACFTNYFYAWTIFRFSTKRKPTAGNWHFDQLHRARKHAFQKKMLRQSLLQYTLSHLRWALQSLDKDVSGCLIDTVSTRSGSGLWWQFLFAIRWVAVF